MSAVTTHCQSLAKAPLGQPLPTNTFRKHTFPLRKRVALRYVLQVQSQAGFGRGTVKIKDEEGEVEREPEPSSGTKKFLNFPGSTKIPGTLKLQGKEKFQAKNNKVIFVAGATGKVGSRTVRELLKLGFSVRAGTRNVEKAQALFEDLAQGAPASTGPDDASLFGFLSPAKLFGFLKAKSGKGLEIVECDLEDADSIEPAVGNAGVVVCCIGASEKEVLDVSGPYRIDFKATANLIDAASSAQVNHFVLLTSLGTQKLGFPAAVLNLFWGVLVWKAKAEKALFESGLPYTIVRPGGMERPTDAYKETHNLYLSEADKLFGGQVSNLQVAELIANIVENPDVSVNKIIEAVAETTAPFRPIKEMLEEISAIGKAVPMVEPQSIRKTKPAKADVAPQKDSKQQEEEKLVAEKRTLALKEKEKKRFQAEKLAEEKLAKAQKEQEEKRIRAENEEKERLRLQALRKKYEEEIEAAKEEEEEAKSAAAAALAEKADLEKRVSEIRAKAEAAALAASQAKAVEAAVVAAARKRTVLSEAEKKNIMESVRLSSLPNEDGPKESKPSYKKKPAFSFFGQDAPFTETDVESPKQTKEEQAKFDAESKARAKADKKAAAQLAEQKKQEEAAKKLAEQEAAKKLEAKRKEEQEAKQKEEQEKLERKAKEQAEKKAAEAKLKEAEAKRKEEEAEAKRKEEAEAKRKEEEAEAKRKEKEAEAKRKEEEAEAKRKEKEAEAKRKEEEAEAKRKEKEAEAKRKEEEAEAKRKEDEAEAKRKEEEAEAKKKELVETKKKEEQEQAERLKLEAESKVNELAEQEAAAAAADAEQKALQKKEEPKEAPAPERSKGFRWFWQPAEPDTPEEEQTIKADVAEVPVQAKGFRWFWQPAEPDSPEEEQTIKADVAEVPVQAKVTEKPLPRSSKPLSPYARYPGLKPPSPPLACPPPTRDKADQVQTPTIKPLEINRVEQTKEDGGVVGKKETKVVAEEPSSESQEDIEARARQVQETAEREREALEKAQAAVTFKWPWQKSDPDEDVSTFSSKAEESVASSKRDTLPRGSRPLSPYAQYPNLKPPAPPQASLFVSNSREKDVKGGETLPYSSTRLSPYPGFPDLKPPTAPTPLQDEGTNGAMPESVIKAEEKIVEAVSSSGFKWPWQQ